MAGPDPIHRLVERLTSSNEFGPQIVHQRYLPPRPAQLSTLGGLTEPLQLALKTAGLQQLYRHQAEAIDLLRSGQHVGVTTPTASGKTLIYNLAVTERLLADPQAHALYLFPLKALAQDQLKTLNEFFRRTGASDLSAAVYDGDTPVSVRSRLKQKLPRVILTNPDMLHYGMLAYPEAWRSFFQHLRFVVIDEAHTYRGIFGSHVSLVLRRLRRQCGDPGPTLVASSATMANASEFLDRLTGLPFHVIEESGAPRQGRQVLLINPTASPYGAAASLLRACLEEKVKTIVFTQSRKITELVHIWVREAAPQFASRIAAYRAGYLPEERRLIEQRLFSDELAAVISTSALEAGIDVGGLDACILVGYPGTMISTWQRGGRAGRGQRDALLILIALPDALDQYYLKHPDAFFSARFENCVLDPANDQLLAGHLPCAANEGPITLKDERYFGPGLARQLADLTQQGELQESAQGGQWYSRRKHPHRLIDIRSVGEHYVIKHELNGQVLGSIDSARVYKECHPGAIYLHAGQQFEVIGLDLDLRTVQVRPSEAEWYTQYTSSEEVEVLDLPAGGRLRASARDFEAGLVHVRVTEKIVSYERHRVVDQSLLSEHKLNLPPRVFETQAVLITVPAIYRQHALDHGLDISGGLHAAEHALIAALPIQILCDRWDLGGLSTLAHPQIDQPCIFVYDGFPGGVGLAPKALEVQAAWVQSAWEVVDQCGCEDGCPACIQSPKCGSRNQPLDKSACRMLLKAATQKPFKRLSFPPGNEAQAEPEAKSRLLLTPRVSAPAPVLRPVEVPFVPPAPRSNRDYRLLVFDLETQRSAQTVGGWDQAHRMGLSLGVVYDHTTQRYTTYREEQAGDLMQELLSADRVVGFNLDQFDLKVMSAYSRHVDRVRTFDLCQEVHRALGHRVSLDQLGRTTLGRGKSADGLQAITWFEQGNWQDLETYCRQDVEVTRDLFFFGLQFQYLLYDRRGVLLKLPVAWQAEFPDLSPQTDDAGMPRP